MRRIMMMAVTSVTLAATALAAAGAAALQGAWEPETYILKDGTQHRVRGRIFFTASDWTVLFFVLDADGKPKRGSAEGGTYTLSGNRLVFTHLFNLSSGAAMTGLPEAPVRLDVREPASAPTEPCTIELTAATALTIHFPSGNAMTFRRSSR